MGLITDRFIGQLALKREGHALGIHLTQFAMQNLRFDERINDLSQLIGNITLNGLLPDQTGHAGEFLTTDGATASWAPVPIGTVTSVSVVTANGFAGTVATATTTPAITLTTTITGILIGNGTAISAAIPGTDYLVTAYTNVEDEGIAITQRSVMDFVGAGVTVTDVGAKTTVTIPGGGVPTLTATEIAFGDGANLMTSSPTFTRTSAKVTITPDGTGVLGGLYITRGDAVNQYIVLHENVASPNTAYLTFKSSGGNAIAMGATFAAGVPVSYVFTDPAGVTLADLDVTTGDLGVANLSGVGTRMVTASAAGVLATAAIPAGFANPMTTLGDIIYEDAVPAPNRLAGHTNADKRYLSQTGTGAVSAAPIWSRIDFGDITSGIVPANLGGTGISNNAASTLTISGAFATTLTVTGATGVTLPTTGTLATLAGAESLTNKKLGSLTTNGFVKTSGGDGTLSVDTSAYWRVYSSTTTSASHTGTTGEVILASILVPANTYAVGTVLKPMPRFEKTGTAGTLNPKTRIHTSVAAAGNLVHAVGAGATTLTYTYIKTGYIKTTTNTQFGNSSLINDDAQSSTAAMVSYNIDWTIDQYIIFAVQLGNGADTGILSGYDIFNHL